MKKRLTDLLVGIIAERVAARVIEASQNFQAPDVVRIVDEETEEVLAVASAMVQEMTAKAEKAGL